MNKVLLSGFVGQDAKFGTSKSGTFWANISLATSRKTKDNTYETDWHRVVAFGKVAEILALCKKGDPVFVEGELQYREYEKDGVKKTIAQIWGNSVIRGSKKPEAEQAQQTEPDFEPSNVPF